MPSKSKSKGNKFENDIVKILNEAYDTKEFSRTPNSGAIMGRTNWGRKEGLAENVKRTLGSDIIVPDDFRFAVECKHYADTPNYAQIIKGPDTMLTHWLAETVFDAINLNLNPLLFFKTNRKGIHFAVPEYFYIMCDQYEGCNTTNLMGDYFTHYGPFVISGIDTFLQNADGFKAFGVTNCLDPNFKDINTIDYYEHKRKEWFQRTDVQALLEVLEEK